MSDSQIDWSHRGLRRISRKQWFPAVARALRAATIAYEACLDFESTELWSAQSQWREARDGADNLCQGADIACGSEVFERIRECLRWADRERERIQIEWGAAGRYGAAIDPKNGRGLPSNESPSAWQEDDGQWFTWEWTVNNGTMALKTSVDANDPKVLHRIEEVDKLFARCDRERAAHGLSPTSLADDVVRVAVEVLRRFAEELDQIDPPALKLSKASELPSVVADDVAIRDSQIAGGGPTPPISDAVEDSRRLLSTASPGDLKAAATVLLGPAPGGAITVLARLASGKDRWHSLPALLGAKAEAHQRRQVRSHLVTPGLVESKGLRKDRVLKITDDGCRRLAEVLADRVGMK